MAIKVEGAYLYYMDIKGRLKVLYSDIVEDQIIDVAFGGQSQATSFVFTPPEKHFIVGFCLAPAYFPFSATDDVFYPQINLDMLAANDFTPLELMAMSRNDGIEYEIEPEEYRQANTAFKVWVPYNT